MLIDYILIKSVYLLYFVANYDKKVQVINREAPVYPFLFNTSLRNIEKRFTDGSS